MRSVTYTIFWSLGALKLVSRELRSLTLITSPCWLVVLQNFGLLVRSYIRQQRSMAPAPKLWLSLSPAPFLSPVCRGLSGAPCQWVGAVMIIV